MTPTKPWKYTTTTVVYDEQLRENIEVPVTFWVDWAKLARLLAAKAHASKGKRTALAGGAILLRLK